MDFNDPSMLKVVFAAIAGLAVGYFFLERLLTAYRLRKLDLKEGIHRHPMGQSSFDVEFRAPKRTGGWSLSVRVKSLRKRNFSVPLPLPERGGWHQLGREFNTFALQAFELGMDRIEQRGETLEVRSRSFRPIRYGYPGFLEFIGKSLEQIDWKLSCIEEEISVEDLPVTAKYPPIFNAAFAAIGALVFLYAEPVVNERTTTFENSEVIWIALMLGLATFLMRFWHLRTKVKHLRRKPPILGDAVWNATAIALLSCFPVQHLNIRLDASAPKLVHVRVVGRQGASGFGMSQLVKVRAVSDEKAPQWRIELEDHVYAAVVPGSTSFLLRIHPGFFGMEWAERVKLEDPPSRGVASGEK